MLGDAKLRAFIGTARPDEAKAFFSGVLGLTLVEDSPFSLIYLSGGVTLHVQKVEQVVPPVGTALGWTVTDIAAVMQGLAAKGVRFERFDGMGQDEHGVWTPPGGAAKICWFKDPDGNLLSLTQS